MELGVIGISYKKASLDVREKVSFTDTKKMELFQILEEIGITQSVILSTCNRSEVYFLFEEEQQKREVKKSYQELFPTVFLDSYIFEKWGKEAILYLYRVAAGLESLVLGEDQILGQTAEALEFAKEMGFAAKEMNKIFRDAITCAKRIKTELKISQHPLSLSYIGLKKLNEECPLENKNVLVIGSGKMASLTIPYLLEYGVNAVFVCSRSGEHANDLREKYSAIQVKAFEERYQMMMQCDVVISATSAPHIVISKEKVEPVNWIRYLLDLGAPRDIDPKFAADSRFVLLDIDSLKQTADENRKQRESLAEQGVRMIEEDAEETVEWLKSSRVDTAIESLQNRCSEIVEDTFSYLNRKMELSEREKGILKKTLHVSLQKLIREPIHVLKGLNEEEEQDAYMRVVHQLFGI